MEILRSIGDLIYALISYDIEVYKKIAIPAIASVLLYNIPFWIDGYNRPKKIKKKLEGIVFYK